MMLQQSVDSSGVSFTPLVVLELASDTKEEAVAWLLSRIRDKQQNGGMDYSADLLVSPICFIFVSVHLASFIFLFPRGAELLVEQLGPGDGGQEKENPNMFLVGATRQRLLTGAEEVGLFKEYNDGSMRGFTCANKHNFTDFIGKVRGRKHKGCCLSFKYFCCRIHSYL